MTNSEDQTYLSKLIKIALDDGRIDVDEQKMIRNIMENIEKYNAMLENALDDGIISLEEKSKLYSFRARIYKENLHLANDDLQVTEKEKNLLIELNRVLNQIREKEQEFPSYKDN